MLPLRDSAAAGRGLSALVSDRVGRSVCAHRRPKGLCFLAAAVSTACLRVVSLSQQVHPSSMQQLLEQHHQQGSGAAEVSPAARCFLQLASGSDCVLHTRCVGRAVWGVVGVGYGVGRGRAHTETQSLAGPGAECTAAIGSVVCRLVD